MVYESQKRIPSRQRHTFPDPLRPVTAEKEGSQPVMEVLTGYDLKPSRMSSSRYIARVLTRRRCGGGVQAELKSVEGGGINMSVGGNGEVILVLLSDSKLLNLPTSDLNQLTDHSSTYCLGLLPHFSRVSLQFTLLIILSCPVTFLPPSEACHREHDYRLIQSCHGAGHPSEA